MTAQQTSFLAHASILPMTGTLRAAILVALHVHGPSTAEELEALTDLSGNTVRPRLVELRKSGCVVDSGRTRKTKSGRLAVVWQAV